eukprot:g20515.t1
MSWLPEPKMDFECQAVLVLSELYDVMGDHLALQYAGSVAHKKYQLLGSRPRMWQPSQELLTSIHRHYNNSFTDREKQACLNLFLGLYQPAKHPPMEKLDCDNWLHHKILKDDYNPNEWWVEPLQSYRQNMIDLAPGLQDWFRQVHKVHKYTYFEKLLANVEATFTFVQVNTGNRLLKVTGKFVTEHDKRREEMKKEKPESQVEKRPLTPKEEEDIKVYTAYADPTLKQFIKGTPFEPAVPLSDVQPLKLDSDETAKTKKEDSSKQSKSKSSKRDPIEPAAENASDLFEDMTALLEKHRLLSKTRNFEYPQDQKIAMKLRTRREKHFKHNLREMGVGPCEPVQAQESNKESSRLMNLRPLLLAFVRFSQAV